MHVLTEAEVHRLLDPRSLIPAIEEAFRSRYPSTLMPTRTQMKVGVRSVSHHAVLRQGRPRPGHEDGEVQRKPRPLPKSVCKPPTSCWRSSQAAPSSVIPANYPTDARTAATSAVATKFLAREDARFWEFRDGPGTRAHLQILRHVRPFERALVTGRDAGRTREFAQQMEHELGMKVESVYSRTCAAESTSCVPARLRKRRCSTATWSVKGSAHQRGRKFSAHHA
mgnify:CR=1 FL=1